MLDNATKQQVINWLAENGIDFSTHPPVGINMSLRSDELLEYIEDPVGWWARDAKVERAVAEQWLKYVEGGGCGAVDEHGRRCGVTHSRRPIARLDDFRLGESDRCDVHAGGH
jgi:hypothetical protein